MTPSHSPVFRDRLETASGFQSVSFVKLSSCSATNANRRSSMLTGFPRRGSPAATTAERTVIDHFYDFLEKRVRKFRQS